MKYHIAANTANNANVNVNKGKFKGWKYWSSQRPLKVPTTIILAIVVAIEKYLAVEFVLGGFLGEFVLGGFLGEFVVGLLMLNFFHYPPHTARTREVRTRLNG